jgi:23S rRNA pseudouridine2605 synthase
LYNPYASQTFMLERLQKIIARAGLASRRHAEELIASGCVTVNGRVITELGTKADESRDHIKISGKLLRPAGQRVYLLLHKPPAVVSTMSDPEGRVSLRDLLGELANRILRSHNLSQTYQLKLKSLLTFAEIEALSRSTGARISRLRGKDSPWYEATLSEARRDALRNRLFQTGHRVEKMKRTAIGTLTLESLLPGRYRALTPSEVSGLSRALDKESRLAAARRQKPIAAKPRKSREKRGKF